MGGSCSHTRIHAYILWGGRLRLWGGGGGARGGGAGPPGPAREAPGRNPAAPPGDFNNMSKWWGSNTKIQAQPARSWPPGPPGAPGPPGPAPRLQGLPPRLQTPWTLPRSSHPRDKVKKNQKHEKVENVIFFT